MSSVNIYQYIPSIDKLVTHRTNVPNGNVITLCGITPDFTKEDQSEWFSDHERLAHDVLTCLDCERRDSEDHSYHALDLNYDDHFVDLWKSFNNDQLIGIVSEAEGGIIAYAIGEDHANIIINALKEA